MYVCVCVPHACRSHQKSEKCARAIHETGVIIGCRRWEQNLDPFHQPLLNCWAISLTPGALRKKKLALCLMRSQLLIFFGLLYMWWVFCLFLRLSVFCFPAFHYLSPWYDFCLPYLELTEPGHVDNIFTKRERASAIISLTIFLCPFYVLSSPPLMYTDVLNYILRFSEPA